jgi:hypothetical protein
MSTQVADKCRILKQHEAYGYQIAYYLLQNEELALKASVCAIRELLGTERLYQEPPARQKKAIKDAFIRHSLMVKGSTIKQREEPPAEHGAVCREHTA